MTSDQKLDLILSSVQTLEDRFNKFEGRFDRLEQRFDGLEKRFDGLEKRFEQEIGGLKNDIGGLKQEVHDLTETAIFIKDHGASKEDLKEGLHVMEQRLGRRFDGLDFRVGNIESTLFHVQHLLPQFPPASTKTAA